LDSGAVARALNISGRTARRWLASWWKAGVAGIRRERSRGRYGERFVASADLPTRWKNLELPPPQPTARAA
jgi:hypothetical protein